MHDLQHIHRFQRKVLVKLSISIYLIIWYVSSKIEDIRLFPIITCVLSFIHSFIKSVERTTRCFKKVARPKTFRNIFAPVKYFCVKFSTFVGNSYPHISTNFCRFILIFHRTASIFPRVPIVFTLSSFEY